MKYYSSFHLLLSLLLLINATASSQSIINTLPGFHGTLPFKLETGYIGVGEEDEVQLFYYFIESENDPQTDPLILWLTGGPGCSGFSGLVYEIGPLAFDVEAFDGSFPSFITNPYSWTKVANIIFIDSPVGTGFSYATTSQAYNTSDTKSVEHNYLFLRKWLSNHPEFVKNHLYIAGDSYGGKIVPMVALEIAKGNEARIEPRILIQGYIVGNSRTDPNKDENEKLPYAHRMALVSDEYFELAKRNCNGEYVSPDPDNIGCLYALQLVNENYNYVSSYVWANNETVQEALQIRQGTISDWKRCNRSLSYEQDVLSVSKHHQLLSDKGFQALAYSGDHDMIVPYMSTLKWIRDLNLTLDEDWRPWTVDGQVAGYTMKYKNNQAELTFATVKGAGHTAPEYKPKQCLAMIKRWLSLYPL
ncbi:serine carboxypeptidase-like 18 isoform X3 [Sesamum indicum]|uniref:Serine carboxypeptidase-like 18 isoform X3 n=1 Tax=Sesamum indicum TaxID=4182 RepID=A0A6I9UNP7_SESIN|nr:serine carboxypeptidase-like 18 isoform X3 [Sesamum indicum]